MQKSSPIKKRILQVIDLKNITKYEFYKKSGITRGILDQNNGISEENIARFLECMPDVNANWLLTGEEPTFTDLSTPIKGSKNIIQSGGGGNNAQIIQGKNKVINRESEINELQTMKQQDFFLEKENELLKREIELLKREIELLKREKK